MAPIKISSITEKLLFGTSVNSARKSQRKFLRSPTSANSGESFGSFGEMGVDEAVIIVNPCEYTLGDFERDLEPNDNPYSHKD